MYSWRIGDVANNLIGIEVDHHHMGCVGHVEPPRGAIDGEIIPAAFATDFDLAGHVIAGRGRRKKESAQEPSQRAFACGPPVGAGYLPTRLPSC